MALATRSMHNEVKSFDMKRTGGLPPPRWVSPNVRSLMDNNDDHVPNEFQALMRILAILSILLLLFFIASIFLFIELGAFEQEIPPRFDWHHWEPGKRLEQLP